MCKMKCGLSEMDLKIIAVSNRKLCERPFLEQIERVCQMKPQAIILREKDLSEEEYRILSEEVLSVCKKYEIPCILHKFWKTALELECTSVHLPLPELRKLPEDVKEQFQRIGTSVHSVEDAKEADYYLGEHIPDVAIVDLGLPDEDGLSLIRRWRSHDVSVPVLSTSYTTTS